MCILHIYWTEQVCDYLGQPQPFENIDVAVWSEGGSTLHFQISTGTEDSEVVCTMAMTLNVTRTGKL